MKNHMRNNIKHTVLFKKIKVYLYVDFSLLNVGDIELLIFLINSYLIREKNVRTEISQFE